jgi:hypothetical protein
MQSGIELLARFALLAGAFLCPFYQLGGIGLNDALVTYPKPEDPGHCGSNLCGSSLTTLTVKVLNNVFKSEHKVNKRFVLNLGSLHLIWGIALVCLVSAIGISLGLQGWNSQGLNFDISNFIEGAHDLLSRGTLPDRGDVSSYGSFSTPGTAWLMLPGMLLFADPRLFELVGSASLYFGTLRGLFLLARMCFGVWCASLSVLLYGLSRSALFYAGSLWPIGHPFF